MIGSRSRFHIVPILGVFDYSRSVSVGISMQWLEAGCESLSLTFLIKICAIVMKQNLHDLTPVYSMVFLQTSTTFSF